MQVVTTRSGIRLSRDWCLPRFPFIYVKCEVHGSHSDVVSSWLLVVFVLGLMGGILLQANIRAYLCLTLSYLFRATSDAQFVAASGRPGCLHERTSCRPRLALTSTWPRDWSAKVSSHFEISRCLLPSAGCLLGSDAERASGCSPQQGSATQVGMRGIPEGGAGAASQADAQGGESSTQERWHLWYGRMTLYRGPGGCSFSFLSRATNLRLFLRPFSARAHGD